MGSVYGRIGRDPKSGQTKHGKPMCSVSLAVDVGKEYGTEIFWVTVLAFNANAEALENCRRGDMLSATGLLTRGKYTAADGSERDSWTLRADGLHGPATVHPLDAARGF